MTMIGQHLKTITKQISDIMHQNNKTAYSNARKKYGIARLPASQLQLLMTQQQQLQQLYGKKTEMARMTNPIMYSSNNMHYNKEESSSPIVHLTSLTPTHGTRLTKDISENIKISHFTYKDHTSAVLVNKQASGINYKKAVGVEQRKIASKNTPLRSNPVRKQERYKSASGKGTGRHNFNKTQLNRITSDSNPKQNILPKYKQILGHTKKFESIKNKTAPKLALTFNDFTLDNIDFKGLHFSHGVGQHTSDQVHVGRSDEFSLDTGHSSEKFRDNSALYFAGKQQESTYHKCCLDYCEASPLPKCDPLKQIIPLPSSTETHKDEKVTTEQSADKKQVDSAYSTGDGRHFIRHEPYGQDHGISYGDPHDDEPYGYYGGYNDNHRHNGGVGFNSHSSLHHNIGHGIGFHHAGLSNRFPLAHSSLHYVNRDKGISNLHLDHHHAGLSHPSILPPDHHDSWNRIPDHGIGMLSRDHHHAGTTDTHILPNNHGDWARMPDHGIGMLSHDHHHAGTDSENIFPHHGRNSLSSGPDNLGNLLPHHSHGTPYYNQHSLGSHFDHGIGTFLHDHHHAGTGRIDSLGSSGPDHLGNLHRHHSHQSFAPDINEMQTIDKVLTFDRLQEHHCKGTKRHRIEAGLENRTVDDMHVPGIECLIQKNTPPPTPGIIPEDPSKDHGISALLGYLNSDAPSKSDIKPPPATITDPEEEKGIVVGTPISITEGDQTESQFVDKNQKVRHQTAIGNFSNGVLSLVGNEQPPPVKSDTVPDKDEKSSPDKENTRHRKKNKDDFEDSSEDIILKKFNENLKRHRKNKQRANVDDEKDDEADKNYSEEEEHPQERDNTDEDEKEENPHREENFNENEHEEENKRNRTSEEPDKFRGNITDDKNEQEGRKYNERIEEDEPNNEEEKEEEDEDRREEMREESEGRPLHNRTNDAIVEEVEHSEREDDHLNQEEPAVRQDNEQNEEAKHEGTVAQVERTGNESSDTTIENEEDNTQNKFNDPEDQDDHQEHTKPKEAQNESRDSQEEHNENESHNEAHNKQSDTEDNNKVSLKYEEENQEQSQKEADDNEGEEDIKNLNNADDDQSRNTNGEPSSDETAESISEKNNEKDEIDRLNQEEPKNHSTEDNRLGSKTNAEFEDNSRSRPENQSYKEENPDDEYRISSDDQENTKHDKQGEQAKVEDSNNDDDDDDQDEKEYDESDVHNRSRNNHNNDNKDEDDEDDRRSSKRTRVEKESIRTKRSMYVF